jgi:hypothetical protein
MKDIPLLGTRWRDIPLIIPPNELKFFFNGLIPNFGKGPIGIYVEKIVKKPNGQTSTNINVAGEIAMVSGFPDYSCFFHSFIFTKPDSVLSYNSLSEYKLNCSPPIEFVRNQLRRIVNISDPLLVGYGVKSDLNSLDFKYTKFYDIQIFFVEFNDKHDSYIPISLRRIYKKFFNIDIQNTENDCIQNAVYAIQIYEEIILDWKNVSKKYNLKSSPFEQYEFPKIN